jgi:hypothetical protein
MVRLPNADEGPRSTLPRNHQGGYFAMRKLLTVGALIAGLAAVTPSIAAAPADTSLLIMRQATFVGPEVQVTVELQCPAGTDETVGVHVAQQQAVGPATSGSSFEPAACTGAKQTVEVLVSGGPFTPGSAFARATGFNAQLDFSSPTPVDSRVIDIS